MLTMIVRRWRYDARALVRIYSRLSRCSRVIRGLIASYSVRDRRINFPSRISIAPTPESFR